ncbi:MAG TPA: protein-glutamine glutaminase family protein [Holophagaceae bacterium]|nr:protein-glutamine glutaminase family protein [Holophagaceae bacterium]HJW32272.1 protein-glutamine glutaminase family protein [Holophagaceae bacterium]
MQDLTSPDTGERIKVSVVEEAIALEVFRELAAREDIPYPAPDGSFARAHKMVRILDDRAITAAKAWIVGSLYVDSTRFGELGFTYHVAPLIWVKAGKAVRLEVLDPSLFDKPVPYETWKAKLLAKPKAELKEAFFTTRFVYVPEERKTTGDDYAEEALRDMNQTNRDLVRQLFMFDRMKRLKSEGKP